MPSRLRVKNTFGERPVEPESKQAKSVYLISIAGEGKTEEQYFDGLYDLETTKDLIKIERLEKIDETDTKSHPNHVINLLDERKEKWQAHGIEPNELWMVIDRDKQNVSEKQLKAVIDRCKKEKYNLALSNPTFELWLLLHIRPVSDYDKATLLENPKKKANSKKRFIEKELSLQLNGYNKNKLDFNKFITGINKAVERANKLPTDNDILIKELGTSVGKLVEKLI